MDPMDPNNSQDQTEQEQVPEIPLTAEEEESENNMEEQPEGSEFAQEDEDEEILAQAPVKEEIKPKEKKGKGRPKKSAGKSKEPPSKKRKRYEDAKDDKENQSTNEVKKGNTLEDGEAKTVKGSGRGRKKGESADAWSEDVDKILIDIVKKITGGTTEGIPWKEALVEFQKVYPETQKTPKALQMRWQTQIKPGFIELTEEQTTLFKQAVKDIAGSEKSAAIAWRYKILTNSSHELTKGTISKLLKNLGLN
ncbi:hypothetical protein EYR41_001458 [Orbilia oligospora]|uniref:Uncharacterized protein n=1 Tax=Orbilia oligospora TaxID=2813651 RepID=A0A7C8PE97_ORBOL|nr:hypothetical protein TWF751_009690 [Orbilia oligospora]KAF3278696.1 hypothetical protein TWF132_000849 [Orbilia oligospora]TGJ74451.1 hypothetical protein EYR41_001458 [Orbilia oligospora]